MTKNYISDILNILWITYFAVGFSYFESLNFVQAMEVEQSKEHRPRYIFLERADLYRELEGCKYFIEDGKEFLKDNFNIRNLDDWTYIYQINQAYQYYWSPEDVRRAQKFIIELCEFLQNYENNQIVKMDIEILRELAAE